MDPRLVAVAGGVTFVGAFVAQVYARPRIRSGHVRHVWLGSAMLFVAPLVLIVAGALGLREVPLVGIVMAAWGAGMLVVTVRYVHRLSRVLSAPPDTPQSSPSASDLTGAYFVSFAIGGLLFLIVLALAAAITLGTG